MLRAEFPVHNTSTFSGGFICYFNLTLQAQNTPTEMPIKCRLEYAGPMARDETQVACCYARQEKAWVADPDGNEREIFMVIEGLPA
jgi:hypothetical protein